MKRTHHLPTRLVRWTSLCVCFVLVLSCFVVTPANHDYSRTAQAQGQSSSQDGNVKKAEPSPPVFGPPAGNFPNLDEVKLRRHEAPRAPEPVASTIRSRRKPIESRRGRKVGDPLPRPKHISSMGAGEGNEQGSTRELASSMHQSPYQTNGAGGNLLALSAGSSILKLFRYPAFHLYGHPALAFLHYVLRFAQAIAISSLSLSLSSPSDLANESTANSLLSPLPEGNGYTYSRSIAIDHTKVPNSDQVNFPLLISGTYSYLATVANGGRVQNSNGYDIIFTSDSGCATKLNHEVETYNPSTGAVNYWVKVPTVSHTSDTMIYMCYGNSGITTDQSNKTAVWDANYKGVWHLPNGTSLTANDSTSSGVNGTITSTGAATGQIDGCGSFDGSSSKIEMGNASALDGMTTLTISAWIKPNSLTGANRIFTKWRGSFLVGTKLGAGDVLRLSVEKSGGGLSIFDSPASTLSTGSWQHCVLTWSQPNTATMYVNGTAKSVTIIQDQSVTSTGASSTAVQIGYSSDGLGAHFDGLIDEVRMSNVVRSADWSKAEYNNQSLPSTFYTISNESGNRAPLVNAAGPYSAQTGTAVQFSGGSSSDPDGTIASYAWNFGDGNSGTGATPTHAYAATNTYSVTLTVTDNLGATNTATTSATISNRPPVANAGGPYSALTGSSVSFNGGSSSDPDGTIASYSWNFGDGNSGSGATPTHTYATAGAYTVTLTVTDNLGAQASGSSSATITAPTADYYMQNFVQIALARPPSSDEVNYWTDIIRAAYAHGQGSMVLALREMGKTIFESAEYAARARSDHDYVHDLYKTFLLREPDSSGWAAWEALVPSLGRDQVRRGFDESPEFQHLVPTLTTSGTPSSAVSSLATARVDPFNQPGSGLLARDAEWSMPLLGLPGRAGLDLGLSLSYSSAVWTRSGPYVYFDEDNGSPSPGFRLGFPTIQEKFFDAQAGVNVYLLIASGHRVELRQVSTSNVYEAADSSYLQLTDNGSLLVKTTDGTQLSYGWVDAIDEYRCIEIKDRNGNYVTVNYDWRGDITTIKDTLSRTITFNYDTNANLISITQDGRTQPWVTFGWGTVTMQPSITGAAGTYYGEVIPVLTQVGLDDGSSYNFEYTGAGQVNMVRSYRSDNVQRSYTGFQYSPCADNSPRLTAQRVWAENWTGVNGVPNEVVTQFNEPGDGSHVMTAPDGTIYKEFYGTGWQKGLTTQSEVWSGGTRQKWTTTARTQDNTSVNYQTNPRVTETNIYDVAGNRRRTTINYDHLNYAQYGLPYFVSEYAADGSTEIRRTFTDYRLDQPYLDRHIVGLVAEVHVTDLTNWQAKLSYGYDDPTRIQSQATTATQHDQSYDASFLVRGNVTSVSRWDVTDIENATKALTNHMSYDAAGSVLTSADPLGHQTTISYDDAFSDSGTSLDAPRSFATFAYPTTATDADGNSSYFQYNYDFGGKTRAQGPPPAGQTQGVIQTMVHDSAARLQQVTTTNTGAYTHYVYGPNYVQSYSTVNTVAANFLQADSYAIQVFDGAGRVIGAANYHPGSAGGFSMVNTIYDLMGRAVKQSNPGEINGSWVPLGDDAAGLLYTQQTYDWKGRPLVTTNTDGTQKYASYTACGCAGNQVTTLTDEVGRQQKVYSDVLGRMAKTEVLNWDGSVYAAMVNTYNARDQVTQVRHYQGADNSGTYQDSTMAYDGYGRLQTKHVPEQDVNTATTYTYNADDTVYSDTDARGATCTYGYNNRHQVTSATHTLSGQASIALSYGYDAAGNRTSMTDSLGSMTYSYDQLSRLTSETRYFSALSSSATGGNYGISYQYNLASELTSITDPFDAQIAYTRDSVGRTTAVTGSGYANVSSYVSNIQYRAWGGVKAASYGNNSASTTSYNNRLQPSQFRLTDASSGASYIRENYSYWGDGHLQSVADLDDTGGNNPPATLRFLSRSYGYDQAGRVAQVYSSSQAPLNQTYGYDEFDNMTSRSGTVYWQPYQSATFAYTNNRHNGWSYYADGQVSSSPATATDDAFSFSYDAAGGLSRTVDTATNRTADYRPSYDGNGKLAYEWAQTTASGSSAPATISYIVRSTVLRGEILTRLNQNGNKSSTYVPAEGLLFATQGVDYQGSPYVGWTQRNPLGITETGKGIYDPLGTYIPFQQHDDPRPPAGSYNSSSMSGISASMSANPFGSDTGCLMDGLPTSCSRVLRAINNGQGDKVTVYGFATSVELSLFMASYSSVTTTGSRYRLPPTTTYHDDKGNPYVAYGQPAPASEAAVQFVITPGFQLGFEPNPQNTQVVPLPNLRNGLQDLLKKGDGDCGRYVQKLLDTAAKLFPQNSLQGKNVMDLFEKISKQGGYQVDARFWNTVSGDISNNSATVHLLPWNTYGAPSAYQIDSANRNYIYGALHETLHLAGKGWLLDNQLAEAAYSIAGKKLPDIPKDDFKEWSTAFDNELMKHCPK